MALCRHSVVFRKERDLMSFLSSVRSHAIPVLIGSALAFSLPGVAMAQTDDLYLTKDVFIPAEESLVTSDGNTGDTTFNFYMESVGNTSGTGYRNKENDSSVYVNITYCRGTPRMFVDGAYDDAGTGSRDCTAAVYRARNTEPQRMRNYVNEWGYNHARITSWADAYRSEVRGKWSPDCSTNTYPEMTA